MIAAVQAIQYSPLKISRPRPLIPGSVSEVSPQVRIQGGISAILSPTSPYRSRDYSRETRLRLSIHIPSAA